MTQRVVGFGYASSSRNLSRFFCGPRLRSDFGFTRRRGFTTETAAKHGWDVIKSAHISEYSAQGAWLRHRKTGAELVSLQTPDENKTFGVTFLTTPGDDTGVAHIMEHSVLCGSRKYPLKEPFVELMKSSQQTFLNAMTYPDRTLYPVASCNLVDFYNLVDVYLDAVFYPRCVTEPRILQQEGWHYDLPDPNGPMGFKGVVLNEMKGVYSQAEQMEARQVQKGLFPDNEYSVDSGGDPKAIPSLTFDQYKAFHSKFYHPSNARFWFSGDDPSEHRLQLLSQYLDGFEKKPCDVQVQTQSAFESPRVLSSQFVAEETEKRAMFSLSWVLNDSHASLEQRLALSFLNYLLMGTSASPLYKALIDSNLGSAVIGGGLDGTLIQSVFSVGLKDLEASDCPKVEALILDVLKYHAEHGFTSDAIAAAINSIEFSLRENNTGNFPRGLSLMLRSISKWIYQGDPFESLQWEAPLQQLKTRLEAGEPVFQGLIQEYLLNNKHRLSHTALPSLTLAQEQEQEEQARLDAHRATLQPAQLQQLAEETKALREFQEAADSAEALARVPCLPLSAMPRQSKEIPLAVSHRLDKCRVLTTDLETSKVVYLTAGFPLDISPELYQYLPLFVHSLTELGTETQDFVALSERIGKYTGGISSYFSVSNAGPDKDPIRFLYLRGKAMAAQTKPMLDIMRDLLTVKLDQPLRFKQLVLETKAGLESSFVGSGHALAAGRLRAQFNQVSYFNELTGGLEYYTFICELLNKVDRDWPSVLSALEAIKSTIFRQAGCLIHATADGKSLEAVDGSISEFLASLPKRDVVSYPLPATLLPRQNEALAVPSQVNYVGKAANLYEHGYEFHASAFVVDKYLGNTLLWDQVRVVGGAYGASSSFDHRSGTFCFTSYRDPNVLSTLKAYDASAQFLRDLATSVRPDTVEKAVASTIGDLDKYQLPDGLGRTALARYLRQETAEERQKRRDEVMGTTAAHFGQFGEALQAVRDKGSVAVVGSHELLSESEVQSSLRAPPRRILQAAES